MCLYLFSVLLLQYPGLEPVLDDLLPKKAPLIVTKWLEILFAFTFTQKD